MSQTVVICTFFFSSKFLLVFLWKGKIAKCSGLPKQNCYFLSRELRAKVFFASSTKFAKFIEDFACDAFAPNSSMQVLPKFCEVVSAAFVCVTGLELDFLTNPTVCLKPVFRPKTQTWLWAFFPSASQNPIIYVQTYHHERVRIPS